MNREQGPSHGFHRTDTGNPRFFMAFGVLLKSEPCDVGLLHTPSLLNYDVVGQNPLGPYLPTYLVNTLPSSPLPLAYHVMVK